MTVTITRQEQTSDTTWDFEWTSDLGGTPVYRIYVNGDLVSEGGTATALTVHVDPDADLTFEVLDDLVTDPTPASQGSVTLAWVGNTASGSYRVDEQSGGGPTQRYVLDETGDNFYVYVTRILEDGVGHYFSVTPVSPAGNDGTALPYYFAMVRNPPPPVVTYTYDAGTQKFTITSTEAATGMELYKGTGVQPDFTAAPFETIVALPHVTAAFASSNTYFLNVRRRNNWDLVSQNTATEEFIIDGAGALDIAPPSDPEDTLLLPSAGGTMNVRSTYFYDIDATNGIDADQWLVYLTSDGTNPYLQSPTVVTIDKDDGSGALDWTSGASGDGVTIKVGVRVRRSGDSVSSTNTNVLTEQAETTGPAAPTFHAQTGINMNSEGLVWEDAIDDTTRIIFDTRDADVNTWTVWPGLLKFYVADVLVMTIGDSQTRILGDLDIGPLAANPVQTDLIEFAAGQYNFASGTPRTRKMELDGSGNLNVATTDAEGTYPALVGLQTFNYREDGSDNLEFSSNLWHVYGLLTSAGVFRTKGIEDNATF